MIKHFMMMAFNFSVSIILTYQLFNNEIIKSGLILSLMCGILIAGNLISTYFSFKELIKEVK